MQNTSRNVHRYYCNDRVEFEVKLFCHLCQDVDHDKEPEEEETGSEARPRTSCGTSPVRNRLAIKPARPGADELEQLLRVAKHIISFVTVIRPERGALRWR